MSAVSTCKKHEVVLSKAHFILLHSKPDHNLQTESRQTDHKQQQRIVLRTPVVAKTINATVEPIPETTMQYV